MEGAMNGEYFEENVKMDIDDKTHLQNIHRKNIESVKYSCTQCDKEFTLRRSLKTHIESINEKVKFPCVQCDK